MSSNLDFEVFVSPARTIDGDRGTFSPITSTLVFGERDLVLVDAQMIEEDVVALGDVIEASGHTLTTIFITHGHGDHWYGAESLQARFGEVDVVSTAGVTAYIDEHWVADREWMTGLFSDRVTLPRSQPKPLAGDVLRLEGHELRAIELGYGDISPSAVLHVAELGLVVAGDIVYNQIHQMLALGGPREWELWISSVDAVERLSPRAVVAGHKKAGAPDDNVAEILDGTRTYIRDFAAVAESAGSARDIVNAMRERYPDHGNVTTLIASASAAIKARERRT